MTSKPLSVTAFLRKMAGEETPILSLLADILTQPQKEIESTLSTATSQVIHGGGTPADLVEALVQIDGKLLEAGVVKEPHATRWAALVLERAVHAERERCHESTDRTLAENAPIFPGEKHTLYGVPGPLQPEGFALFADRLLARALTARPKRVVLVLSESIDEDAALRAARDALVSDLREQRIDVKVIRP